MKTNPNDPVDWSQYIKSQRSYDGQVLQSMFPGLTKLEYFSAMALQGILANPGVYKSTIDIPEHAVGFAKHLICQLNKEV